MQVMHLALPFAHLNLRWNPFGEPAREERAALAVVDLPELRPGDVVQFVGPCGRGKSTHLLALAARHPGARLERVPLGCDRFEGPVTEPFLLDEADRVRPGLLRRLLETAPTLAIGAHEDLSGLSSRPLRTIRVGGLTAAKLRAVVDRRIEWARRGPGPVPRVSDASLARLIDRHGDHLRGIENHLYDRLQTMEGPDDVQV